MDEALHRLEQRTNRVYWSDGLLDLIAGVALLAIGVSWIADAVVFGGVAPAVLIPLWKPLRRSFTEPRLGRVELADPRQNRTNKFVRMTMVGGVLSFLLGIGAFFGFEYRPDLLSTFVPAMPGVLLGLLAVGTAEGLELPRFFSYGAVLIAAGIAVAALGPPVNPGWAMVAGGAAMLIGGVVLAIRLIRNHPRTEPGDA